MVLSNDGKKSWATVLFLSAIKYRKVIHVNFFAFSAIFAGPWFVEIQKMFFYHGNVTTAFKEKKLNVLLI